MAKLTLHGVYGRFRADMFLSSLTESSSYISLCLLCPSANWSPSNRRPYGHGEQDGDTTTNSPIS